MVDDDAPKNVSGEAVVGVDDIVARIDNLARIGYLYVGLCFEYTIHGLAHNLNIPLHSTSQHEIAVELFEQLGFCLRSNY